ncbi:MAG: hypothetical protein ACK5JH_07935 [Anaerocolumna sp.]
MSKMNDRMEGRNQGIVFALEIAREGGIEALERLVAERNISGLSMTMSQKEIDKNKRIMQFNSTRMSIAIALITLLDEFGMGKYQVRKFKEAFDKKVEDIIEKNGDTAEMLERIENELDLRITFD